MTAGTGSDQAVGGGPLSGVLVADFSRILAGPYATMLLADMGADALPGHRHLTAADRKGRLPVGGHGVPTPGCSRTT